MKYKPGDTLKIEKDSINFSEVGGAVQKGQYYRIDSIKNDKNTNHKDWYLGELSNSPDPHDDRESWYMSEVDLIAAYAELVDGPTRQALILSEPIDTIEDIIL